MCYPQDMNIGLNFTIISHMSPEEAYRWILKIEEELIPSLPPIKTRTKRVEDVRSTFEDKFVFERVYLQMCLTDLYNRVGDVNWQSSLLPSL